MGEDIFIVKREVLFKDGTFQGFITNEDRDFIKIILELGEYKTRTPELEKDASIQQIIPYVWLVNPVSKKVFLYKRAGTGNESRLYQKFSGGVGGHVDKKSVKEGENPVISAMMRELEEETIMKKYPSPNIVGYINDDADSVGSVHFGVVAIGETTEAVLPAEDMAECAFYSISEVEALFDNPTINFEPWTLLSWPFVKSYVAKL